MRFMMCGLTSFLAYVLLRDLSSIETSVWNSLISDAIKNRNSLIIGLFTIFIGYLGLYASLISVALFNSLLKENQ